MGMSRQSLSVLSMANAVAMRAKCGQIDRRELDALAARTEALGADHAVTCAVSSLLSQWPVICRDPEAIARGGDRLQGFVLDALRPVPVDLHRVDIHG